MCSFVFSNGISSIKMNHSLSRVRCHTLPFNLNDSEIDLAPSGPIPLSVKSWFINNSFHPSMTWNPKTPQIEMQKCCVDSQWFTQHFRSLITQFVVCHQTTINHHSLLQSSIAFNSQTLQRNCCQSGVWFQHFTQCNCSFNSNRVICSSFIKLHFLIHSKQCVISCLTV